MGLSGVRKRRCSTGVTLSGSRAVLRATDALSLKRRRRRSLLSLQEPQEEDPRGGRLNGWGPDDGLNRATRRSPSETSRGSTGARALVKIELSPATPERSLRRRNPRGRRLNGWGPEVVPQQGNQEGSLRDLTGVHRSAGPRQNGALACANPAKPSVSPAKLC